MSSTSTDDSYIPFRTHDVTAMGLMQLAVDAVNRQAAANLTKSGVWLFDERGVQIRYITPKDARIFDRLIPLVDYMPAPTIEVQHERLFVKFLEGYREMHLCSIVSTDTDWLCRTQGVIDRGRYTQNGLLHRYAFAKLRKQQLQRRRRSGAWIHTKST